jgi:CHAT domain-containing protein
VFSRREATAILSGLPADKVKLAVDFAASRDDFLATDFSQFRIVHLATHGTLNETPPDLSGLTLSTVDRKGGPVGGELTLPDIYHLKLPVDLVVLSACDTALGERVTGESLVGLTRGFMYAGASRVVSTLSNKEIANGAGRSTLPEHAIAPRPPSNHRATCLRRTAS